MNARQFNSLEELLNHIREVVETAEAEEAGVTQVDDEGVSDFDLRRAVVKAVIDQIGFGSPEEFAKYVEFIYNFMAASED